jgi:hypothetical protein
MAAFKPNPRKCSLSNRTIYGSDLSTCFLPFLSPSRVRHFTPASPGNFCMVTQAMYSLIIQTSGKDKHETGYYASNSFDED